MKIIRTDRELETPMLDSSLKALGHDLVLLPDGVSEEALCREIKYCDLLLMCYTPISKKVIQAATKLKAIVKYGVGIDAIDIPKANKKQIAGAALDVFSVEPLNQTNHFLKDLYQFENVILLPHLTFYTKESMERLERETLDRCSEVIEERPVLIKSDDPRLQNQAQLNTIYKVKN